MAGLQRRNGGARRRLGDVQVLGGARHVQPLGDGDEDAELFQRHGSSIAIDDRFGKYYALDCLMLTDEVGA